MCRVSHSDESLSPTLRKRSSFSNSSRSSDDSSIRKRVSFDVRIKVYPLERLENEQLGDVFYCQNDYRRFRSDSCLELLDQQLAPNNTLVSLCQKLLSGVAKKRKQKKKRNIEPADYPWMTPYHPNEQPTQQRVRQPYVQRSRRTIDVSEARRMVEELAFLP